MDFLGKSSMVGGSSEGIWLLRWVPLACGMPRTDVIGLVALWAAQGGEDLSVIGMRVEGAGIGDMRKSVQRFKGVRNVTNTYFLFRSSEYASRPQPR